MRLCHILAAEPAVLPSMILGEMLTPEYESPQGSFTDAEPNAEGDRAHWPDHHGRAAIRAFWATGRVSLRHTFLAALAAGVSHAPRPPAPSFASCLCGHRMGFRGFQTFRPVFRQVLFNEGWLPEERVQARGHKHPGGGVPKRFPIVRARPPHQAEHESEWACRRCKSVARGCARHGSHNVDIVPEGDRNTAQGWL